MLSPRFYVLLSALSLAACSGAPSTAIEPLAAPDAGDAGEVLEAAADAGAPLEAAAVDVRIPSDAAGDVLEAAARDAGEVLEAAADAGDAGPVCDPAYGDASPGGACCVHVWATPTMGGVVCTDGTRWCWQTGAPCAPPGVRCVMVSGVEYCAP